MTTSLRPARSRLLPIVGVVAALALALGFLGWVNGKRAARVLQVSATPPWSVDALVADPSSPTGYADGRRWLIVPVHNNESYQWIAQTQQALATGEWRLRRVDYENAPLGREVHAASPYRWWLGLMARLDHAFSDRPLGQSVERAALFADPVLHGLLLASATGFVVWRFGALAAVLLTLGLGAIFPFSTVFAGGTPGHQGLALACALWSLLLLAAGTSARATAKGSPEPTSGEEESATRRYFVLSGVAAGLGVWISVGILLPILLGTCAGAILTAVVRRWDVAKKRASAGVDWPWRAWAWSGAAISLCGFLAEYFPSHMTMRLEANHPLYALAWVGAGELLARATAWIQGAKPRWTGRDFAVTAAAVIAIAAVVVTAVITHGDPFAQERQLAPRLSIASAVNAKSFAAWIVRDGFTPLVWATVLPLAIIGVGAAVLAWRRGDAHRATLTLGFGPLLLTAIIAASNLWWWNLVDVTLLGLAVAATAALAQDLKPARVQWVWSGVIAIVFVFSGFHLVPRQNAKNPNALTYSEGESYIERDLAHWLALHAAPDTPTPLVLAPPSLTTTLCFHGGLRGLGTLNWENKDGIMGAVRMVSALSAEETQALVESRGVTHFVIPSWEPLLDEYARLGARADPGSDGLQNTFLAALHRWDLPEWLRPIAYTFPAGNSGQSVVIFEIVDAQNPAVAMSRLTEYFIEMGQVDFATRAAHNLERFPSDVSALVALAEIALAQGDTTKATAIVTKLLPLLRPEDQQPLPFDRRVSLAIMLAQFKQSDRARQEFDRCLAEADPSRLHSLSIVSLYRLELLCKFFNRPIPDPDLRAYARSLLPPDLRSRL